MTDEENTQRPLRFWLRVVDNLLAREFAARFTAEGVDRRDAMLLSAVDGDIDAPWIAARLERGGKRVRALVDRGWLERRDDGWALTDEGRAAKERLATDVDARVAEAVPPEDYATMTASLEAVAREFGWDEGFVPSGVGPRGFGRHGFGPRPGFGHGDGHGFGPRHGVGPGDVHGFAHGAGGACHPHHHRHDEHHGRHGHSDHDGRRGHDRRGQRAYERGFDAGFERGRQAPASGSAA